MVRVLVLHGRLSACLLLCSHGAQHAVLMMPLPLDPSSPITFPGNMWSHQSLVSLVFPSPVIPFIDLGLWVRDHGFMSQTQSLSSLWCTLWYGSLRPQIWFLPTPPLMTTSPQFRNQRFLDTPTLFSFHKSNLLPVTTCYYSNPGSTHFLCHFGNSQWNQYTWIFKCNWQTNTYQNLHSP